ncbi:MAG TPA: hypothetical protein VN811_01480 [Thermoanaerobaculia bacterium]|nr:hypothetical protein [Thermoanaerobaculia bacterium]
MCAFVAEGKVWLPRTVGCWSLVLLLAGAGAAWAGTSNAPNPVVTFDSPGTKQVVLEVCNANGCTQITQSVVVLNPSPSVIDYDADPTTLFNGFVVHFSAAANGAPPLTYTWRVVDLVGTQVATFQGATTDWTANVAPGLYSVYLDVSNVHGTHTPVIPIELTILLSPFVFSDGFEGGSTLLWQQMPSE